MKLIVAILFVCYYALCVGADEEGFFGATGKESGTDYGERGDQVVLKVDCTTDADCAGIPDKKKNGKGACQNNDAYLAVLPKEMRQADADSLACAWAKVLAGKCSDIAGVEGKKCSCHAPDDDACTYLFLCKEIVGGCGPGNDQPNCYRNLELNTMCACPRRCERARAGFQHGPKPSDECSFA